MVILRCCFNLACFSTAFGMTSFWLYKYLKDEDLVQVDVKPFEMLLKSQYPMLSFCFWNPFIEQRLKFYNTSLTNQRYLDILKGEEFYNGIEKIDFDDVTLDLENFYFGDVIKFRNGTWVLGGYPNFLSELPRVTYSGLYDDVFIKCFGLKLSHTNVAEAGFRLNSSMFPNGIRENELFSIHVHLPKKLLMAGNPVKLRWKPRITNRPYEMRFTKSRNFEKEE